MRVVSLVPSLTLTLFDLGLDATEIVGRTPWCIHPDDAVGDVPVVGGTKTPTLSKIQAAQPNLVVMDKDENPKEVHDWCLAQGYDVFVCHVRHPDDVSEMLRDLGKAVNREGKGVALAEELETALRNLKQSRSGVVLPFIWNEPLMVANGQTYAGGMLSTLGWTVPVIKPDGTGYPTVTERDLLDHRVEGLLMSSEPYDFSLKEGEALADRVVEAGGRRPWVRCIDGEALTWMGSHTLHGLLKLAEISAPELTEP